MRDSHPLTGSLLARCLPVNERIRTPHHHTLNASMSKQFSLQEYDVAIVGGGINGCGIARDAALRGLKVLLCEAGDLACATSSASTKLIHGGLRYLEQREFRLVRESLLERECLLRIAPHVIWPLRFILPHDTNMRPAWMIRVGLFLYDQIARRDLLPASSSVNLANTSAGEALANGGGRAFEYSDCWVDDARFVTLNALDAHEHGATILTHTKLGQAKAFESGWHLELEGRHARQAKAKILVNATGPWVSSLRGRLLEHASVPKTATRLVQGSHLVVPRLFNHDKAYILQNTDRRIVFAIPYIGGHTLVGTTDQEYDGEPGEVRITDSEIQYLLEVINRNFRTQTTAADIIWSYSGVRGLFDDGAQDAQEVTRDYIIKVDKDNAPLVNIFGGKLTTYRKLAKAVLEQCQTWCPHDQPCTTSTQSLPGGDFPIHAFGALCAKLQDQCKDMPDEMAWRLTRAYGTRATKVIGNSTKVAELGQGFGCGLYEAELRYLVDHEWASEAEDVLWRRTKLGLQLDREAQDRVAAWMEQARTTKKPVAND